MARRARGARNVADAAASVQVTVRMPDSWSQVTALMQCGLGLDQEQTLGEMKPHMFREQGGHGVWPVIEGSRQRNMSAELAPRDCQQGAELLTCGTCRLPQKEAGLPLAGSARWMMFPRVCLRGAMLGAVGVQRILYPACNR